MRVQHANSAHGYLPGWPLPPHPTAGVVVIDGQMGHRVALDRGRASGTRLEG